MIIRSTRITIVSTGRPHEHDLNKELQWFGLSLGLFNLRDKDKSCYRIFLELLKAAKMRMPMSSDELAEKLKLTRGTVVHHLNRLMEAGIVMHLHGKYLLRADSLQGLVQELKGDMLKTWNSLEDTAHEIDRNLGL
jgi:predicted transcriptional regulator